MLKAHFSRIYDNTTWNSLKNTIYAQRKNNCIPLPYIIIKEIYISLAEFDKLAMKLSKPRKYYTDFSLNSIANQQGIWNCILIKCNVDKRNVVLYTAGNIYPLYASIINI